MRQVVPSRERECGRDRWMREKLREVAHPEREIGERERDAVTSAVIWTHTIIQYSALY